MAVPAGATAVGAAAYGDDDDITGVDFPHSLVVIESHAFHHCAGIARIDLSHTKLTAIHAGAFKYCGMLAEVAFPSSLARMGKSAFASCTGIEHINLSHTQLTRIPSHAFAGCRHMATVLLPPTCAAIDSHAFQGCAAIIELDLSRTKVATIAASAFQSCEGLATVRFPDTLRVIGDDAFYHCFEITELAFPASTASIGMSAFHTCRALTKLHIPASVHAIEQWAFAACTALELVTMESNPVRWESTSLHLGFHRQFMACKALAAVSVPNAAVALATWPTDMFDECELKLEVLLAAATSGMQLRHYWKPGHVSHGRCVPKARAAVWTILLVAARRMHLWRAAETPKALPRPLPRPSKRIGIKAQRPPHRGRLDCLLPDLPDEIWFCILSFVRRHDLGGGAKEGEAGDEGNGGGNGNGTLVEEWKIDKAGTDYLVG